MKLYKEAEKYQKGDIERLIDLVYEGVLISQNQAEKLVEVVKVYNKSKDGDYDLDRFKNVLVAISEAKNLIQAK